GYSTVPEAHAAFADQQRKGRVKPVRVENSSDDSDDIPTPSTPAQSPRARPRRANNDDANERTPTRRTRTHSDTTQLSSTTTSESSPTNASRRSAVSSRRRDASALSSPPTGVSIVLGVYPDHGSPSPVRAEGRRMGSATDSPQRASRRVRAASQTTSRGSPGGRSPPTDETQVVTSPAQTPSTRRFSPPTDVTQFGSPETPSLRRSSGHVSPVSSPSVARSVPERRRSSGGSRQASVVAANDERSSPRLAEVVDMDSPVSVRSPAQRAMRSRERETTSPVSSPAAQVAMTERSIDVSSSSQYPATTSSSHRYLNTSSSHHALSPALNDSITEESEDEGPSRPWSPATNVTFEEPGSPMATSTPALGHLEVNDSHDERGSESEGADGYETAPSSPNASQMSLQEDSEYEPDLSYLSLSPAPSHAATTPGSHRSPSSTATGYASLAPSSITNFQSATDPDSDVSTARHSRVTSPTLRNNFSDQRASPTSTGSRTRDPGRLRKAYSNVEVQTERTRSPLVRAATHSQVQIQTDSPQRNTTFSPASTLSIPAAHCRECHQPLPSQIQPGLGHPGDQTVPASPALSTHSLRAREAPFSPNALGLTQSEHIISTANEPAFDPRSPLGRSASLPLSMHGLGRPSPRMYDGTVRTAVRR
ncbi:hypothetical protein EIP91_007036, partial [Steccherinum ochraceum]